LEVLMSEIVFLVEEDPEGGYTARALGESIFTEGETEDDLKSNIKDALRCHFDNESEIPPVIRLHFVRDQIITYA
jgi:predicted RNase H-like HicB family nuclease